MGNGGVVVPPDSTGKNVDCSSLSVGGVTSYRQRIVIADPTKSANFALCSAGALQVIVTTGAVSLAAGTSKIGFIGKISAGVVLAAGAAHVGEVNISVMPAVALAAGTQHVGEVNISIMPAVVVTSITNAINISAMPSVNVNGGVAISGTATAIIGGFLDPSGNQRNVVDSANTALRVNVVAGGAGGGIASGPVAVGGSATAGNFPVLMGGVDAGSLVRNLRTDANGNLVINNISATVNVQGTLTIGGQTGNASATAGSTYTLIGGMDGSIGRVALTDAAGHFVITGTVALAAGAANIGTINNISAAVGLAAGTQHIGEVNISIMPAVVLAAGTANIGTLNNISAAVSVVGTVLGAASSTAGSTMMLFGGNDGALARVALMDAAGHQIISGTVVLAAGAANIGSINNISAAVVLAAGAANIGSINNISANVNVVLQTGTNNIGTIQAISAAVGLAAGTQHIGEVNISLMPIVTVNIGAQSAGNILVMQGAVGFNASVTAGNSPVLIGGRVKTSASTTATAHSAVFLWMDKAGRPIVQMNAVPLAPSATHGPKSITLSTSATTVLIASAGTAVAFVDSILVTNGSATLTQFIAYEASATATPVLGAYLAASGGGFTHYFNPPWRVSVGTALNGRIKPNVSQVIVTIHFHVGPD